MQLCQAFDQPYDTLSGGHTTLTPACWWSVVRSTRLIESLTCAAGTGSNASGSRLGILRKSTIERAKVWENITLECRSHAPSESGTHVECSKTQTTRLTIDLSVVRHHVLRTHVDRTVAEPTPPRHTKRAGANRFSIVVERLTECASASWDEGKGAFNSATNLLLLSSGLVRQSAWLTATFNGKCPSRSVLRKCRTEARHSTRLPSFKLVSNEQCSRPFRVVCPCTI